MTCLLYRRTEKVILIAFFIFTILFQSANAKTTSSQPLTCKLEFRIVPKPSKPDQFMSYIKDLDQNGPLPGRKRGDQFQWFKIKDNLHGGIKHKYHGEQYVLLCAKKPYVMLSDRNAWGLRKVYTTKDNNSKPAIIVEFDDKGAKLFYKLTKANTGNTLAILLDDKVISAPVIRSALSRQVIIVGQFTQQQADNLVKSLSITLSPTTKPSKARKRPLQKTASQNVQKAVKAAQKWLALVDDRMYAKSWEQAAEYFKNAVPKKKWQAQLKAVRMPLGKVLARKIKSKKYMTSLPGAPDGQYVVIQYETSFDNKKSAIETVTPMKDKDGKWRVSGYYIK